MNQGVGLCATCAFARLVESAKSSEFWLCRRSETDERYAKYPRLPVLGCAGYEREGRTTVHGEPAEGG